MAGDFVYALIYIYIVWCVGQWIISMLKPLEKDVEVRWLSFTAGFSALTLLTTFLYFVCRFPVEIIRGIWSVLGIISMIMLILKRRIGWREIQVFGIVLVLFIFLLIPGIVGKDQYYVYRGNCTDQQTYIEETVALSSHGISWYESHSMEEIALESDVLQRGYEWAVKDRPSAGLMIAVLCRTGEGEIFWVEYLYRMFVQAMIAASLMYLFHVVSEFFCQGQKWQRLAWMIVAALYCIGFWGQIQYDIDAVSQMSSIAVLVALTAVFLLFLQGVLENLSFDKNVYFLMILFASAGLALYLESALVHGALYFATGVIMVTRERRKLKGREILQLAAIPAAALAILILSNYRIVGFLMTQVKTSVSGARQSWASYFNAWWSGKYGIAQDSFLQPVSRLTNFVVSLFGMYNITVNYNVFSGKRALLLTGVIGIVGILMLFCLIRFLFQKESKVIRAFWVLTLAGMAVVLEMIITRKYWSAGKLLYYISPYLYTFLCIPLLRKKMRKEWAERFALCAAVIMLAANGKMVFERAYDMKVNFACTGYRGNYPSDMIGGLKPMVKFVFDTDELDGADGIMIEDLSVLSDYQFYLQYLKVKLTHAHIPYKVENDMNYYQQPLDISEDRVLTGKIKSLSLIRDDDGRYRIEVKENIEK